MGETLTITDVTGKKMAAAQLQTLHTKFETVNWSSGVYFVTIGNRTQKLIIQK